MCVYIYIYIYIYIYTSLSLSLIYIYIYIIMDLALAAPAPLRRRPPLPEALLAVRVVREAVVEQRRGRDGHVAAAALVLAAPGLLGLRPGVDPVLQGGVAVVGDGRHLERGN